MQWTLLAGINDGDGEVDALVELLAGRHAVLNLIPYNAVEGLPWARPADEESRAMARELHRCGVLTKLRDSAGQDVEGGCGQLRARATRLQAVTVHRRDADVGARSQPAGARSAGG